MRLSTIKFLISSTNQEEALYEAHCYTILAESGRTIHGDVLIEKSALNAVVMHICSQISKMQG